MPSTAPLRFPYMHWARSESWRSPYCLSQSGMPAPPAALFADFSLSPAEDLAFAGLDAKPALEAQLARHFDVEPRQVITTVGASSAMHALALTWFTPGTQVVTELPSYQPFRVLPERMGARVAIVERRLEDDWALDAGSLAAALGDGPGHLFLSNPHNPTGHVSDADEVRRWADLAAAAGGLLFSNEVYMEFAPNAERVHAFALAPNAISLGSFTKAYGLGALRVGWLVLPEALSEERERVEDALFLACVDPPTIALRYALAAVERLPQLLQPYLKLRAESAPLLERWLAETPGVEGSVGPHGLMAFPRLEGVPDTRAFTRRLASEYGVDAVAGEFFGFPGHVRLGFGLPPATLEGGLERLGRALAAARGAPEKTTP